MTITYRSFPRLLKWAPQLDVSRATGQQANRRQVGRFDRLFTMFQKGAQIEANRRFAGALPSLVVEAAFSERKSASDRKNFFAKFLFVLALFVFLFSLFGLEPRPP